MSPVWACKPAGRSSGAQDELSGEDGSGYEVGTEGGEDG